MLGKRSALEAATDLLRGVGPASVPMLAGEASWSASSRAPAAVHLWGRHFKTGSPRVKQGPTWPWGAVAEEPRWRSQRPPAPSRSRGRAQGTGPGKNQEVSWAWTHFIAAAHEVSANKPCRPGVSGLPPGSAQLGLWAPCVPATCPPPEQKTVQLLPAQVNPRRGGRRGRPESGGHGRGAAWPKGESRRGAGGD